MLSLVLRETSQAELKNSEDYRIVRDLLFKVIFILFVGNLYAETENVFQSKSYQRAMVI